MSSRSAPTRSPSGTPRRKAWVAEAGEFELRLGSSSRDLPRRARFQLAHPHVAGPDRKLGDGVN